jgi:hypothetical protein
MARRTTCGHAEHTIGFTGRFLGRQSAAAGWEPCKVGPHCEHQVGYGDYADAECCICPGNPCSAVTVADMLAHREYDRKHDRAHGLIDARFAISAGIAEAAPSDRPLGAPDDVHTAAVEAFSACWVIARGDIDEPPF